MIPMPMYSGADLYVRRNSALSKMIAWFSRARREGRTLATHQAKFINRNEIVHAVRPCVKVQSWPVYLADLVRERAEWCIVDRVVEPTINDCMVMETMAHEMVGWAYSYLELPLQAMDGLLSKILSRDKMGLDVVVFRAIGEIWERGVICSKTGNRIDLRLGWKPDRLRFGTPDDSYDYVTHSPDWKITEHSPGWYI